MDQPFEGKVALVTGAGSGIGKASALHLAQKGAKVGLLSRTQEELEAVAKEIGGEDQALVLTADISDAGQVESAINQLVEKWGRLDIVFANAGVNGVWAPIDELKVEEWKQTLDINLDGTFYTIKFAYPHMKEKGGSVIVTSSINGTRIFSNSGATAYSTTKAGQVAMAKMLALELAKHKIRVNVICPGAIDTQIDDNTTQRHTERAKEPVEYPDGVVPLKDGEPGSSDEVADLVCFLASDSSKHITGTEIWIDGAESLLQG